jgi:hypothetical protein
MTQTNRRPGETMGHHGTEDAEVVTARVGAVGLHATDAQLRAWRNSRSERLVSSVLTLACWWAAAPLALLIPPHLEPAAVVAGLGLYFGRRAWRREWVVSTMRGNCPRCDAEISVRRGTVLHLPHTLHCGGCRTELWLELEAAPEVPPEVRAAAKRQEREIRPAPARRPLGTWSPAASDWRDRPRGQ